MESDRRLSLIVGAFVIATLGAISIAVLSLTAQSGLFTPQYMIFARFANVQGLLPGAPVWVAGKQVGSVTAVELTDANPDLPALVSLRLDGAVQSRVRTDSIARIGTIGVLGDAYVDVSVGTPGGDPILDSNFIKTEEPASLADALARGTRALDSIAELADNLNKIVKGFAERKGAERAAAAIEAGSDIMLAVKEGSGLLHSLVYDEYSGGGIESIQSSLASLEDIMNEIREGDGLFHTLIYDSPADQDVILQALEAGAKLNSIMGKVDRGEGSLGLLVNDPTLYEDVKELLGGAQRSSVVRTLVRMAVEQDD